MALKFNRWDRQQLILELKGSKEGETTNKVLLVVK